MAPQAASPRRSPRSSSGDLDDAALEHGEATTYCSPRRSAALLVVIAPWRSRDRDVERRRTGAAAAYGDDGKPTKGGRRLRAIVRRQRRSVAETGDRQGSWLVYNVHQPGQRAAELLPTIAENALNRLPIPKRVAGDSDAQFVRPVHWLVFLHGDQVVPCTLLDAEAGNKTHRHRFHHPQAITPLQP